MRIVSPGFLRPHPDRVHPGVWEFLSGGVWADLPQAVPRWDYATELTFQRRLEIDEDGIRTDCQLPASAVLGVAVTWHATGTNHRGAFPSVDIRNGVSAMMATLPGGELGGQLHLRTAVILLEDVKEAGPLSPRRAGSILWTDIISTHLEGEGSMFPTEEIDFGRAGIAPATAAWYLDWNPVELHVATLGSVRLYINSGHEQVRRAAATPNADAVSSAITSAMLYDLFRQLIEGALDNEDFDDNAGYAPGTIGATLRTALRMAFGREPAETVRALRRTSRSDFEARIQAASAIFSR